MSPAEMEASCNASIGAAREFGWAESEASVSLVTPKGWKPPPGFPRGKLLQVKDDGSRLSSYPAQRLLAWTRKAVAA